ncbi:MAG: YceI family protein [Chloroflexi bacterium]|nr:YceI family protein [Chloroflexota bacterium]
MRQILGILSGTLALIVMAACGSAEESSSASVPIAAAPTATATPYAAPTPAPGQVVVSVNGDFVARYVVGEQLARLSTPSEAVGETSDVSGAIVFEADGSVNSALSRIIVDIRTLESDEARRDNFLRTDSLESNRFPLADFVVQETPGLSWPLPESGEVAFQMVGEMTLHGVTSPLTWDVTAQFGESEVTGQASTVFDFDTFDIDKPSLFFILTVEDEIRLELDFVTGVESG